MGDLKAEAVPDAENAFEYQMKAYGAVVLGVDSPASSAFGFPDYPPYGARWTALGEKPARCRKCRAKGWDKAARPYRRRLRSK